MSVELQKVDSSLSDSPLKSLKGNLLNAPVLAFIEKFDTLFSKKKKFLTKGETLFEPGENPYLYIVASGGLSIFRVSLLGEAKEVGRVYTGECIGEGILSDRIQKEVRAVSLTEKTSVIALTRADIEYLESQDAATLAALYKHINNITSLRLADTSKELALMYEATQKFQEYRELGGQGLLLTINHLRKALDFDSILMIEEHPFVPGLLIHKYNTKFPSVWPLNQKVEPNIVFAPGEFNSIIGTLRADQKAYCQPLLLGEKSLGFLIIAAKTKAPISDGEVRVLNHLAPVIASMLASVQIESDAKARALSASAS
jgi:CRP-like cAMP-binding protein